MCSKSTKDDPLVSIIIPVHNAQDKLAHCLSCVLNQSYCNFEVLIIDNNSDDESSDIIASYKENSKVRILKCSERGVSSARNVGLANAKGEYIQFVDSDDYPEMNFTEKMVRAMEESKADMVVSDYYQFNDLNHNIRHKRLVTNKYKKRTYLKELTLCPMAHYFGVVWNKMYKMKLITKFKVKFQPDISMGEDFIFNMEYLQAVSYISSLNEKLYHYLWKREGSLSNSTTLVEESIEERKKMYRAYIIMFEKEKLLRKWRLLIQYYMVSFYFSEIDKLMNNERMLKTFLYQKCIKEMGINKFTYSVFNFLKETKRLLHV
ncbi:MAG: glycosyltransferase family 2 protein [Suipraeoptans sp.]